MKVLILGGTGAIGLHLVELLSNSGIETFVTSRKYRESKGFVRYIQGNAQCTEFLQPILQEKWDVIVDFMVYTTERFKERVNLLLGATSQYVFISSARVYAESEHPITEAFSRLIDISQDMEYLSTDEYSLTKARQENIIRNTGRKNWTIIRPYITYSESRLQLGILEKEEWLYRALHGRTIVFSSDINERTTTMTYGLNVSEGILSIIGNSNACGEIYNITSGISKPWSEVLAIYLEVLEEYLGYRPKVLLQNLDKYFECETRKYQILYDRLFNREFDNSKIAQFVKIDGFCRMDVGLKSCLEKFLKNPNFNVINWKSEAIKDRQTHEHTPLKEIVGLKQKSKYVLYRYLLS